MKTIFILWIILIILYLEVFIIQTGVFGYKQLLQSSINEFLIYFRILIKTI